MLKQTQDFISISKSKSFELAQTVSIEKERALIHLCPSPFVTLSYQPLPSFFVFFLNPFNPPLVLRFLMSDNSCD